MHPHGRSEKAVNWTAFAHHFAHRPVNQPVVPDYADKVLPRISAGIDVVPIAARKCGNCVYFPRNAWLYGGMDDGYRVSPGGVVHFHHRSDIFVPVANRVLEHFFNDHQPFACKGIAHRFSRRRKRH